MYNLATVLDEYSFIDCDLNVLELKQDMEQLEKEYLDASKQHVSINYSQRIFFKIKNYYFYIIKHIG